MAWSAHLCRLHPPVNDCLPPQTAIWHNHRFSLLKIFNLSTKQQSNVTKDAEKFKIHIKEKHWISHKFCSVEISRSVWSVSRFFAMTIVTIAKIVIIFIILDHTYDNHHNPDCHHIYDPLSLSSPCRITPHHDFHTDVTLYTEQCGLSSAISRMMLILCRLTSI